MSRRSMAPHRTTTADDDNAATPSSHQQQQHRRRRLAQVVVRQVHAANVVEELSTIRNLLDSYPYVTVHAEHHGGGGGGDEEGGNLPPGVRIDDLPAASRYALAKVDLDTPSPYSQLGITLCDANGKLPLLRPWPGAAAAQSVWQVGLHHGSVPVSGSGGSVSSLSVSAFAYALFATAVVSSADETRQRGTAAAGVTWLAYGGLYHLGFLLKVLTGGARLPDTKEEFLESLRAYLGDRVFDGRFVAGEVSLKGPLTHMAAMLGAPAATAVEPWQAGGRSLVACEVFMRLKGLFFAWDDTVDVHAGCIHGLHSRTSSSS